MLDLAARVRSRNIVVPSKYAVSRAATKLDACSLFRDRWEWNHGLTLVASLT